jgi:uncharacterized damage-inducible protein DinB
MIAEIFRELVAYNHWANMRLYDAALQLPEDVYRRQTGVFFGSLHGTLNHLLVADRVWLKRLTGVGEHPKELNAILYEDRRELARARIAEDERLTATVRSYGDEALQTSFSYQTLSGAPQQQTLRDALLHLFNHSCLSIAAGREPPPLDLLLFQRGLPAPDVGRWLT